LAQNDPISLVLMSQGIANLFLPLWPKSGVWDHKKFDSKNFSTCTTLNICKIFLKRNIFSVYHCSEEEKQPLHYKDRLSKWPKLIKLSFSDPFCISFKLTLKIPIINPAIVMLAYGKTAVLRVKIIDWINLLV